jgi:NAD-dependent SIR2 family protein deacetylase
VHDLDPDSVRRAADAIAAADALLIGAGAGMGVDSGLPDFRGTQGFWRAYPPYARLGLEFSAIANPRWFRADPHLAWGFYGHRLELYRQTVPHEGFATLRRWADQLARGCFIYTSNVDGHFARAGFDGERVVEVHGAIDFMQCLSGCGVGIFPADPHTVVVDEATMRAADPLPSCPSCGGLARPNILMFGDPDWDDSRTAPQRRRFRAWLDTLKGARLVAVECGAGTAIPTVRDGCEILVERYGGTLIRINPREPEVPPGGVSIAAGAAVALDAIDLLLDPDA